MYPFFGYLNLLHACATRDSKHARGWGAPNRAQDSSPAGAEGLEWTRALAEDACPGWIRGALWPTKC